MLKKKYVFAVIYSLLLTAFTACILLDTFVLVQKYTEVSDEDYYNSLYADEENMTLTEENSSKGNKSTGRGKGRSGGKDSETETDNSGASVVGTYEDDNIAVTVTQYRENGTDIYVADVKISSMKYFKTAFADDTYGKNVTEKTSETAKRKNAVLAVNGDYYGARTEGYVVRNGILYRDDAADNQEALVINTDGTFEIVTEGQTSASSLVNGGAAHILSFGPSLVKDGEISVTQSDEVGKAKASNPRTAIGIIDKLHYVFVVSDGRTDASKGLSLYQLAEFMAKSGVQTAYNLDGGGSSTMYFNGSVINNPTTSGNSVRERSVSDIVYIGS